MKAGWKSKRLHECLDKVKSTSKIKRKQFLGKGKFPIVSQEEGLVNGYWDILEDVLHIQKPIVIFGDHNQVIKFINFDFVRGADGVKILSPKAFLLPKYLFYFLYANPVKSIGYARHYRFIKDLKIPLPPLPKQRRIVEVLDAAFAKIDRLETITKQNIANAEELFDSKLDKIFVIDAVNWPKKTFQDVCIKIQDGAHHSPKTTFTTKQDGLFPYVTSKNIRTNYMKLDTLQFVEKGFHDSIYSSCKPELNDVLLTKDGASTGNVTLNEFDEPISLLSSVCLIKPDKNQILSKFILFYIQSPVGFKQFTGKMTGTAIKRIILRTIKASLIPVPSIETQEQVCLKIVHILEKRDQFVFAQNSKLATLTELRQSLLQKAFAGELVADILSAEILPFPMKPEGIEPHALQCALVAKAYAQISAGANDNFFYGRTMAEKTSHMMEAYVGIDLERESIQGRHGPTDDKARKAMETYAQDKGYFTMQAPKAGKKGYKLIRGENFDQAAELAGQHLEPFKDKFYKLIGVIKTMDTRKLEVFTTVYAAWNNLLQDKACITDDNIILAARENWHEAKTNIDRSLFVAAIKTLRQNDMVPTGIGKYVNPIGAQGQERFDL